MDSIEITGLRFHSHHGVLAQETLVGNEFTVDLRLDFDATEAMRTDSLAATINYAEVIAATGEEMAEASQLLEHVAYRIRERLRRDCPRLRGGMVRISKPAPPIPCQLENVSFRTEWHDTREEAQL